MSITAFANAKINLTLDVLNKRPDGYHDIDTVMQSISLADKLYIDIGAKDKKEAECKDYEPIGATRYSYETAEERMFGATSHYSTDIHCKVKNCKYYVMEKCSAEKVTITHDSINKPATIKCETYDWFHPFCWATKDACNKLCGGDKTELRALLSKYDIKVKKLDTRY